MSIGVHSRSQTLTFLFTFEIFNHNVHNCLVYFGALSNVIPWSTCNKINPTSEKNNAKITKLDRIEVQVIGELNDVLIRLSSNPMVIQAVDIVVADIPEAYDILLSGYWSNKLQG